MKIAINGFGRIGRIFFRQIIDDKDFDIVAINDLSSPENLAYLLKYDSVYGRFDDFVLEGNKFKVKDKEILILNEKEPENLPWKDLKIDIVVEASGVFTEREKALKHIKAGAKFVVLTAPPKDDILTLTPNLGDWDKIIEFSEGSITSNASCTTNSINPVLAIIQKYFGIKKAVLTTIHAYTNTQSLVDSISKGNDFRRGRAAAFNIVPSTTGAAEATVKVLPFLKNKFDGISIRVPVISGSLSDLTILLEKKTTVSEINEIIKNEAKKDEWKNIIKVVEEQVVSSDILKEPYGAIVDLTLTRVVDGDLVKIFSWYDNEWGYCAMLKLHLKKIKDILKF
jgi:glyceraldehyde 3-phosphate dehydrogenase